MPETNCLWGTSVSRAETGPVSFGSDWGGVFIRGDNAFYYCHGLHRREASSGALDGTSELAALLGSSREGAGNNIRRLAGPFDCEHAEAIAELIIATGGKAGKPELLLGLISGMRGMLSDELAANVEAIRGSIAADVTASFSARQDLAGIKYGTTLWRMASHAGMIDDEARLQFGCRFYTAGRKASAELKLEMLSAGVSSVCFGGPDCPAWAAELSDGPSESWVAVIVDADGISMGSVCHNCGAMAV